MQLDAETLIFDRNLRPAQASNIARMTDLKVIDRTQLILDIFAQHADSSDGKLQVELAQMRYLLPRLGQRDDALSRLTGGIGGRGPGETKLEVGRRRARERITRLQSQLKRLGRQREQRRSRRKRSGTPTIAIVPHSASAHRPKTRQRAARHPVAHEPSACVTCAATPPRFSAAPTRLAQRLKRTRRPCVVAPCSSATPSAFE